MMYTQKNFILGLDVGTTSVKAVLLKPEKLEVVLTSTQDTSANVCSDIGPLGSEQDVGAILSAVQTCVKKLDHEKLQRVSLIGISGQMHGCILWKEKTFSRNEGGEIELTSASKTSRLYTWQDSRCTKEFLASLPVPQSHLRLATGHGCASLFWLQRHRPEFVDSFDRAGTVIDFLVSALCELDKPVMSVHTAASWGYFDTTCNEWNTERLSSAGFPVYLLPKVKHPGCIAGQLQTPWLGVVPSGTRVGVAMGDVQCYMLTTLKESSDAVVSIGTSAQTATRTSKGFEPPPYDPSSPIEYFPYFDGRYLMVAAALNGGNVIATFIGMLQEWLADLGFESTKEAMYNRVLSAGIKVSDTDLVIMPTLLGERHQPDLRGIVSNVTVGNLSMGHVARALCRGVVTNLHSMFPRERLVKEGVSRIIGCGSALVRNAVLRAELEHLFEYPVVYYQGGDAAVGAALAMISYQPEL